MTRRRAEAAPGTRAATGQDEPAAADDASTCRRGSPAFPREVSLPRSRALGAPDRDATRTRTRTRSVRRSASRRSVEAHGGRATPSAPTRSRRSTQFLAGMDRFAARPRPAPTTTCWSLPTARSLDRVGGVRRAQSRAVRPAAAGARRPPRLERRDGDGRLDRPNAAATCEMVDAARGPPRRSARPPMAARWRQG